MIAAISDYLHSLEEALMTFDTKTINTSNVNDLMFTAYSNFPPCTAKPSVLALKELELWRKAIYHDQRAGLIRRDIDREQIALMFTHIKNTYDPDSVKRKWTFHYWKKHIQNYINY